MNVTLRDRVRPPLRVLFVGINPGIRSAATGHHFAGYSNRFWNLLFESGLVPEPVRATDDVRLPEWGYGLTNLIPRATKGIDTLRRDEYVAGVRVLRRKVRRWRPQIVALVGVTVYRAVFASPVKKRLRPRRGEDMRIRDEASASVRAGGGAPAPVRKVTLGLQPELFEGARVFVVANPSGRNANYSYAEMLAAFADLRGYLARQMRARM